MTDPRSDSRQEDVVRAYETREASYMRAGAAAAALDRRAGIVRLVVFAAIALAAIGVVEGELPQPEGGIVLVLALVAFLALLPWHARVKQRVRTLRALERRCRDGVNRVHRQWESLPSAVATAVPADHAFATDLHVAGAHSLMRLLPPVSSASGRPVLDEWLLVEQPPPVESIATRQRAVRDLTPRAEWRDLLSVLASRMAATSSSAREFTLWSEARDVAHPAAVMVWLARVLAVITLTCLAAALLRAMPVPVVMILILLNLVLSGAARHTLTASLEPVAGHDAGIRGLGELLRHVADAHFDAPELSALATQLGGRESARAFAWFDQLAAFAEVRLSPMGHVALQGLALWDFHVADALDRWRRRHGMRVRAWLRALGEVEALGALATLAYDNPTWCFPDVLDGASSSLDAARLAHPLLPLDGRVGNDVVVGASGEILFVTGSNMAGKSTLLRAIGLNIVLAQAGGPVCADRMRLVRVRLRTSIDVADALERGLSLYMAELLRIRAIVDAAHTRADCGLFFLADEMLRGTNAVDRHTAIVTILANLIAAGAVGVVATHDSTLASDERLHPHLRLVHFVEQFREGEDGASAMWFDYKLRPGLSTSRNALKLLELVGLGDSPRT